MSFLPLPDITLSGTTTGSGAGETIELLPTFTLKGNVSATIEVRVIANGTTYPYARVVQSFIQRVTVRRNFGVTSVEAADTPVQFGDSGASSWAISVAAASSPDRLKITFSTGTTQAIATATADLFITKTATPPPIPTGYIQFLRGDLGLTLSGSDVLAWADQSTFGYNETLEGGSTPITSGTSGSFNGQNVLTGTSGSYLSVPSPPSTPVSGTTMALVFQASIGVSNQLSWFYGNNGALAVQVQPNGHAQLAYNTTLFSTTSSTNAQVLLFTIDTGANATMYVNSYTTTSTGNIGAPWNTQFQGTSQNIAYPFAEQVVWPFVLSSTSIKDYMLYASARYGITLV
jgi:hypothetical protein